MVSLGSRGRVKRTRISIPGVAGTDSDAARLVEAVAPLWPGCTVSVRRLGPARGVRSWLVLPSLAQPILLVPPSLRAAGVALQPTGTGRGELTMRALAFLQGSGLLRLLPLPRLVVEGRGHPESAAEAVLAAELGPVHDLVVRLGRRRFNRALVLLPFAPDGRLLAVVKVARGDAARRVLEQEHDTLVLANQHRVEGLRIPAPLAQGRTGDLGYLAMSPLTSPEVSRPRPVPVRQMVALADVASGPATPLRDTVVVARLRQQVAALDDPTHQEWTGAALDELLTQLGDVEVPVAAWHGDWVPWNMARQGDEVLLWDWEHFDLEALRGWDHIHYLAQDLRTLSGTTPAVEDAWLAEAHAVLSEDWLLEEPQRWAVLRSYLLEINLRYLHDRQEDPSGTPGRDGWARQLVERLGHQAPAAPAQPDATEAPATPSTRTA